MDTEYQKSVIAEREAWEAKISALAQAIGSPKFTDLSRAVQHRMIRKHATMVEYSDTLEEEISEFGQLNKGQ